jgi:multisubunit Na+/H+ antiporter MnhB subunit
MISEPNTWALIALALILPALAVAIIRARALFAIAALLAGFALVVALALMALDAPDLALVQVATGIALLVPLFLGAAALTAKSAARRPVNWPILLAALVFAVVLIFAAPDLPAIGERSAGVGGNVGTVYVNRALGEAGLRNAVMAVSANYRAIDSLLAAGAVFLAGLGVYAVLGFGERSVLRRSAARDAGPEQPS